MTEAEILALIQAGSITIPTLVAEWNKMRANNDGLKPLSELFADAEANDDATIAQAKKELGQS